MYVQMCYQISNVPSFVSVFITLYILQYHFYTFYESYFFPFENRLTLSAPTKMVSTV